MPSRFDDLLNALEPEVIRQPDSASGLKGQLQHFALWFIHQRIKVASRSPSVIHK
jgi:hypothetical protein